MTVSNTVCVFLKNAEEFNLALHMWGRKFNDLIKRWVRRKYKIGLHRWYAYRIF